MIVWKCDRCSGSSETTDRRNKRPNGWESIQHIPPQPQKGAHYLLCDTCAGLFHEFITDER